MTNGTIVPEPSDQFSVATVFDGPGFSQRGGSSSDSGVTSTLTISSVTVGKHNFTCFIRDSNLLGVVELTAGNLLIVVDLKDWIHIMVIDFVHTIC